MKGEWELYRQCEAIRIHLQVETEMKASACWMELCLNKIVEKKQKMLFFNLKNV